jgi:threonyl-tRNA synthetase
MLIVGEREEGDGSVSVREHHGGDAGSQPIAEFADRLRGELYS